MKKIIALNLKMNLNYEEALNYVETLSNEKLDKHGIVVLPSYIYLDMFRKLEYNLGAQNVYFEDKGAYTGEISPSQLKTLGISYALIGHSERRIHFNEDNELINKKIKGSLRNNLNIILCVGETEEEKDLNKTSFVLEQQLIADLNNIENSNNIIIAYEPVWAIGSGKVPKNEEIEESIKFIKSIVNRKYNIEPKVLYGGSVNKENINTILKINNVDGVLVGSASVDPKYLISMIKSVE
ncbi:MAG: triose-phosphate isomerase [Bacilli bacterium]|nr:triose-phosphate isomerase [Bacilli bacterium]MDD4411885.1 triose-phosphate isomerase [Bacilli bacterium]